jgi:hypothetical protein
MLQQVMGDPCLHHARPYHDSLSVCEDSAGSSEDTSDLCLVLGVALHWSQLMEAMGKLALAPIAALPGSRPCPAQLSLQQAKHLELRSLLSF